MSTEQFGSKDALPPQPPSGNAASAGVPGYPPAGQQQRLAAIRAQEAAAQPENADALLEGELASLDAASETPSQRRERLGAFVGEFFSDICPSEYQEAGVRECVLFEDTLRGALYDDSATLLPEDAKNQDLREKVIKAVPIIEQNKEAIAMKEGEQADLAVVEKGQQAEISDQETSISDLNRETELETAGLAHDEGTRADEFSQEAEINRDLQTVKELQASFEELKAKHGTIGALKMLLGEEGVKSPEMRAIVQRAVNTAQTLVGAIPGKEAAIERLLDQSGLNLGAASQAEVFASLFTAAEASDDFTDEDIAALRRVVNDHEGIDNSSEIKNALAEGRETITHEDGSIEMVGYDEENPLIVDNLSVYPDGDLMRGTANFDGLQVPFKAPLNTPSSTLNERLNVSMYTVINEAAGVTGGTNQGFEVTQGMAEIDLSDEVFEGQATREAKLGIENMTDSFDIGTGLIDRQTIKQLAWGHQWLMRGKDVIGDAGFGDNDERARAETLGGRGHDGLIWGADDRLNEENFKTACQYIRGRARTGMSEPDVAALIAHVERVNGVKEAA